MIIAKRIVGIGQNLDWIDFYTKWIGPIVGIVDTKSELLLVVFVAFGGPLASSTEV